MKSLVNNDVEQAPVEPGASASPARPDAPHLAAGGEARQVPSRGVRQTVRAKVFEKDGNRFLIPGLYYFTDDDDAFPANIVIDAMMFGVCLGVKSEPDWFEFTTTDGAADIPNRIVRLSGRQFAHGGVDVWVIGGPLLADALRDENTSEAPAASGSAAGRADAETAPNSSAGTES